MKVQEVLRFTASPACPERERAFIDVLRSMLEAQGIGTRYYSLRRVTREASAARWKCRGPFCEPRQQLRLEHGSGVRRVVVNKLRQDLSLLTDDLPLVVIVDAIRNPEEVAYLQRELAPRFDLVAVDAPLDVLVSRIAARARYDEPAEFVRQKEAARRMILGEAGNDEPAHGHNIRRCMDMANWTIDNSASLDSLAQQVEAFIGARIRLPEDS